MIKNREQYLVTTEQRRLLLKHLIDSKEKPHPEEIIQKSIIEGAESLIADLNKEIEEYFKKMEDGETPRDKSS